MKNLTAAGKKTLRSMRREYGPRAEEVFARTYNARLPGSSAWVSKRVFGKKRGRLGVHQSPVFPRHARSRKGIGPFNPLFKWRRRLVPLI
jgi:hypothetical protein